MKRIEVPVLVVGAGPVGLTTSILLSALGIENLIVERRDGTVRMPQAHVASPRSLEILRSVGMDLAPVYAAATPPADARQVRWVTRLAGDEIGMMDFEASVQDAFEITPTPLSSVPQDRFEALLLAHQRTGKAGALRFGHAWEGSEADAEGVVSRVRDLADGSELEIGSRWLIAADGAGSPVRKALGIPMQGPQRIQSFLMIHFEANLRALLRERPALLYWLLDPDCRGTFIAHDIESCWIFMHPIDADAVRTENPDRVQCEALVRRAIGREDVELRIRDVGTWTMTAQVAEQYREGRIFLAGDAAHRFPPTGGVGMNTGIQDAHNLVWKLAAVEAGWAAPDLLESYERERRPIAQENCDYSLRNALQMAEVAQAIGFTSDPAESRQRVAETLADPAGRARVRAAIEAQRNHFDMIGVHLGFVYEKGALVPDGTPPAERAASLYVPNARPGARLPHAWLERDGARISTLDLADYGRFTLLAGSETGPWQAAAGRVRSLPLACVALGPDAADRRFAELAGIGADGALLVRPDQHVGWRTPTTPADPHRALEEATAHLLAAGDVP